MISREHGMSLIVDHDNPNVIIRADVLLRPARGDERGGLDTGGKGESSKADE